VPESRLKFKIKEIQTVTSQDRQQSMLRFPFRQTRLCCRPISVVGVQSGPGASIWACIESFQQFSNSNTNFTPSLWWKKPEDSSSFLASFLSFRDKSANYITAILQLPQHKCAQNNSSGVKPECRIISWKIWEELSSSYPIIWVAGYYVTKY
jgi:hypothetical protein